MDLSDGQSTISVFLHPCLLPASSELCLPATSSYLLCLIHLQFSPLDLWVYIILSYGHSQPDWCQLSLKWQCCEIRNSGRWSSVWVPWPLRFLSRLSAKLGYCSSSRSLFWLLFSLSVNMQYRQTHASTGFLAVSLSIIYVALFHHEQAMTQNTYLKNPFICW